MQMNQPFEQSLTPKIYKNSTNINNGSGRVSSLPAKHRTTLEDVDSQEGLDQTVLQTNGFNSNRIADSQLKVGNSKYYEVQQNLRERNIRNEAGSGLKIPEQREQRTPIYSINTESGAIFNNHSALSSRSRPLSTSYSKQALLIKMTNRMASELERRTRRFAKPLKLHLTEFGSSPSQRNILNESKASNRDTPRQNKPLQNLKKFDPEAALKTDVKNWKTEHERHAQLINNGLKTFKDDKVNQNKSFSHHKNESKTLNTKTPEPDKRLNLTMDNSSNVLKHTTDNQQNMPTFRRITSRVRTSTQQLRESVVDSSFGKAGNSFGKSERTSVFDAKNNIAPGPKYDLAAHKSIALGHNAPKINLVSYDRSEFLAPNTISPSPQKYYQNREFEKDGFKSPSPIFGYERNSSKKQTWEERLKKINDKKIKESPKVPYYNLPQDPHQCKYSSFPKDHHREIFKFDKEIPGPGNYHSRGELQNPVKISFGRAKRRTDPAMKKFKTKKEVKQYRIFVSTMNSIVGQAIVETIRNDYINDENPHIIYGTLDPESNAEVPSGAKEVINNKDIVAMTKALLSSNFIIYDIERAPLDEIEYAIKAIRTADNDNERTFILVSSVMTWSATPPKAKTEEVSKPKKEEVEMIINEENPDGSPVTRQLSERGLLSYTEDEYPKRRPSPKYYHYYVLENLCLEAGTKKNLSTYIVCSGVQYGHGETYFHHFFTRSWIQQPGYLAIIGEGNNVIPTIHVRDLAEFVNFIIEKKPTSRYILAVDKGNTQKEIVQSICNYLGDGVVKHIDPLDAIDEPYYDVFSVDLQLRTSNSWEKHRQQEEDASFNTSSGADFDSPISIIPRFDFEWRAREGFVFNFEKVVKEFFDYRQLRRVKIFIHGYPAAGKSHFSNILSKLYNLPVIRVGELVAQVMSQTDEFSMRIRSIMQEIRQKMIEEAQAAFEVEKKKNKKKMADVEFDPSKIQPRVPDDLLYQMFKWRLSQNDSKFRGYILDSYPRTYSDAKELFMTKEPQQGDQPIMQDQLVLESDIAPDMLIVLEATDDHLKSKIKTLIPPETIAQTHYTDEAMNRRLLAYKKANISEAGSIVLENFFHENHIPVEKLNTEGKSADLILKAIQEFILAEGSIKNYDYTVALHQMKENREKEKEAAKKREKEEEKKRLEKQKEEEEKRAADEKARQRLEALKEEETKLLDIRSQPLRQYLADMVVPGLTEGIIEVCKVQPADPVEFLADFLAKRSEKIRNQDKNTEKKTTEQSEDKPQIPSKGRAISGEQDEELDDDDGY